MNWLKHLFKKQKEETPTPSDDKDGFLPPLVGHTTIPVYYEDKVIHFHLGDSENKIIENLSRIFPEIKPSVSYLEYDGDHNFYRLLQK